MNEVKNFSWYPDKILVTRGISLYYVGQGVPTASFLLSLKNPGHDSRVLWLFILLDGGRCGKSAGCMYGRCWVLGVDESFLSANQNENFKNELKNIRILGFCKKFLWCVADIFPVINDAL